jgi:hypothetical protein
VYFCVTIVRMNWSLQRKLIYGFALSIFITGAILYTFRETIFPAPTCFDKEQNGYETGIDCGGTCSLRCKEEVIPLALKWTRVLETSSGKYDLVALVTNKNISNAPRVLTFTFLVYDDGGNVTKTITGTSTVPVDGDFPIIVQNVALGEKPRELGVELSRDSHFAVKELPTSPTIRITNVRFEQGSIPKVFATVTNTKRTVISKLPVRAVLYGADGNAFGVGETIIPFLDKEGVQTIAFTWDKAFAETPIKTTIYPIFDPFIGGN